MTPGIGFSFAVVSLFFASTVATVAAPEAPGNWPVLVARGELVDVVRQDPSVVVELRYAASRNGAGVALYPADFPVLLRPATARKLSDAQRRLRTVGLGLKVWDAYRPATAQRSLWQRVGQRRYVANPESRSGSMHTRGVAVDVTLVNLATGRECPMPTDFDDFSLAAVGIYRGPNSAVGANLRLLHRAMTAAGFLAQYREWWHFTDRDWRRYGPLE